VFKVFWQLLNSLWVSDCLTMKKTMFNTTTAMSSFQNLSTKQCHCTAFSSLTYQYIIVCTINLHLSVSVKSHTNVKVPLSLTVVVYDQSNAFLSEPFTQYANHSNISTPCGTVAIHDLCIKILWRSSQGNPSIGRVKHKRGSRI